MQLRDDCDQCEIYILEESFFNSQLEVCQQEFKSKSLCLELDVLEVAASTVTYELIKTSEHCDTFKYC